MFDCQGFGIEDMVSGICAGVPSGDRCLELPGFGRLRFACPNRRIRGNGGGQAVVPRIAVQGGDGVGVRLQLFVLRFVLQPVRFVWQRA